MSEPASVVQSWMRRTSEAHKQLKAAIADFNEARLNLAFAADAAGDELFGRQAEGVEGWVTMGVLDVLKEVQVEEEAAGIVERHVSRDIISDERDAELRREARERAGCFERMYSSFDTGPAEDTDGEHQEAP